MGNTGPYTYEIEMPAAGIVRVLDLALTGLHPATIGIRTRRTENEARAILKAHGWPNRDRMLDMRAALTPFGRTPVCFDVEPFKPGKTTLPPEKKLTCPDCPVLFSSKESLRSHRWSKHGTTVRKPSKQVTCDGCGLETTARGLKAHRCQARSAA